jgi:ADP-ribose pyrophosphatase YjhB (NUDIX family)
MRQFCNRCGTPMERATIEGRERERCPACGFVAYHNPAPVALAVIEHDGRLVLIRRSKAPLAGYWAPPAGYVELGESVPEAVVREAREETGLTIALDGLLGVYSQPDVSVVLIAYRARAVSGEPVAGDDAADIGLFGRGRLPVQLPPQGGSLTDQWFYGVIRELTAPWRKERAALAPRMNRSQRSLRVGSCR